MWAVAIFVLGMLGQSPAQERLNQSIQAFRQAQYEAATAYFEEALRLDPASTVVELHLAAGGPF